ncbi:MAG: YchJ family metal-binding protein [Woeseiaceae bacterium]
MAMLETSPCLCGASNIFNVCCGKFILNHGATDSAEQLMRSRYSAYILKDQNYLLKTWHESTRPSSLDLDNDSTQWKKLKIISASKDIVQFVAYFIANNDYFALSETSHFIKDTQWFYEKGNEVKTIKLTKNMPCPCLSGKKFKRCCEKAFT